MSVVVEMSHPYLSLEHLVHAIAKAIVQAQLGADSSPEEERAMVEARLSWETELRLLCSKDSIVGHAWDDGFKASPWAALNLDHDVFWIEDLNGCKPLNDAGLTFTVARDEDAEEEFEQFFGEYVYNGHPIDWGYWVMEMPTLVAADAARLMRGLDPDVFKTLSEKPNRNNASDAVAAAIKIERLALAQGKVRETPENWLLWATARRIQVELGFKRSVMVKQRRDAAGSVPPKSFAALPPITPAFIAAQGLFTLPQASEAIAAQEGVNSDALCLAMGRAAVMKHLHVRDPQTGGYMDVDHGLLVEETYVKVGDVNAWLPLHGVDYLWRSSQTVPDSNQPQWSLKRPERDDGLAWVLHRTLDAERAAGKSIPSARFVMEMWTQSKPKEIIRVLTDGVECWDIDGDTKTISVASLRSRIARMTTA